MLNKFINFFKQVGPAPRITDQGTVDKEYKRWRLRMFIGMYVGYVVFYFTRKNISPVLHIFSKELEISALEVGIFSSVFYVTYGIGKFLSGTLADKSNIRIFMPFGLFCASVINILFASFESLWLLAFFWGLNGVFQSMGFPPVAKGLVHWFSPSERATKWTIWSSSHTLGTFLIGLLIGLLIKYFSWRSAFYIPGLIGILTSFYLFWSLRDRPVSLGLPPIEEYANDPIPVKAEESASQWEILKTHVFTNRFIWYLCCAYIFIYLIRFGTLDWATKFMYDVRGIDKVKVAFMWTIMPLFGVPGGIVAGYLAERFFQGRCTPVNLIYLVFLGFSILGFYHFAGMDNFFLTCFFLGAIGFFVDGPQNLVGGVQVSRVTTKNAVSAACGLAGLFGYVGAIISGAGLGYITQNYGWGALYATCIGSCVIAAFFILLTYKQEGGKEDII